MNRKEYFENKGLVGKSDDEIKMWLIHNMRNKIKPMYMIMECGRCGEVLEDGERFEHKCEKERMSDD